VISRVVRALLRRGLLWGWLLVLLLAILAVAPLTYPGFFEVDSGFLSTFRAARPLETPAWTQPGDLLRGEGRLPYILAWPFLQISGSSITAVKWGYGLAFLLGASGVYVWLRRRLGLRGAVLAATVYTYLPWHLATVYVRGAYAEAWLWAFWPFVLWAVDRLAERHLPGIVAALAVGLPALIAAIWTQPGLAALFLPIALAYAVVMGPNRRRTALRLASTLAAIFVVLLVLAGTASAPPLPFDDHFLYPFQLLSAYWGYGPGPEGAPFQLGLAAVGLGLVAVALGATGRRPRSADAPDWAPSAFLTLGRSLVFWSVVLLLLVLLTLPLAAPFWRLSRFQSFLTYPWQVLALAGLPLATLAGSVARLDRRLRAFPAWAGLLALVVLASYSYLAPRFTRLDPGPEPVAILQPQEAGAPRITLLDTEIEPPTEVTPTLTLTLTWQAVAPIEQDYTVFAHLLAGEEKVAQRDTQPCSGECPTGTWQPGQIVVDRYRLDLPAGAPPGPYRLAVGLYLLETGDRVPVLGRDDQTVYLHVP
jgi:hypothetical protein